MTVVIGGMTTVGTGGAFQLVPAQCTLSVANDGDGDAVTCTVDGDTGAQNYVLYRLKDGTTWTAGGDRSGDGDVAISGLDNRTWYEFTAYSIKEGGYGSQSGIVTMQVSDGGTLATQTLAEMAGHDAREYRVRTLQADTWERWYKVRLLEWDTLTPDVADEYFDDANQIVANVRQSPVGPGADTSWMIVTYAEISNKGWSSDYAETRRVDVTGPVRTVRTFGISKAADSAGIPAIGDLLDGGSGLAIPACVSRNVDDRRYPGLWVWEAEWKAHTAFAF